MHFSSWLRHHHHLQQTIWHSTRIGNQPLLIPWLAQDMLERDGVAGIEEA
jgi:hypothetical protein